MLEIRRRYTGAYGQVSALAREYGISRGNVRFIVHDYVNGPIENLPEYDLGWCCEFVEHVEEQYSDNFLETFKRCKVLVMTHAVPGQQGFHHVNCQDSDYWKFKLMERGYDYQHDISMKLRELTTAHWVKQTLMVFVRVV